jgi:N-acetylglucosamine-6-phosphate deacetylase
MTLRITNGRLCLPDGTISQGDLILRDGLIATSGQPSETIDARGLFVAPGFVDIHVHGARGRDAMEATPEAFETICRHHAAGGTTTLALTTVCASWKDIGRVLDIAREWRPQSGVTGARLAGVHVEGPYFSTAKRGAHREEFLRTPAADDIDHWTRYTDVISKVTLAPELPGARELIAELTAAGIRTSGGHSDAWGEEADAAFDAGMRQVTHTFNCMSSARRRGAFRVAGLLEAALARPDVICEVIADGYHVEPTLLRMLWAAKGPDRVALITDATAGAGLAIGEEFDLGGIPCRVGDGVAFTADGSALAGSTCGMIDCVRSLVREAGVPLGDAIRAASRTPAAALGLEMICGTLTPGAPADMVVFDEDFRVRQTWVGGRVVYRASDE